jgi:hypothetical protein
MDIRKSVSNVFFNKAFENAVVWQLVVKQEKSFQVVESKEFQELIFFIC